MKLFDLQFSALNHPDSSAAMRLSNQEMHFFSFGFYHHDLCLVKHHKLKMDNNSMLHFTLVARDQRHSTGSGRAPLRWAFRCATAASSPRRKAPPASAAFVCRIPTGTGSKLSRSNANDRRCLRSAQRSPAAFAEICAAPKRKWFREFVLLPPTISRRRFSNKTEDYGVFKPSQIDHIGQLSIYVQDIERSRRWYEELGGLRHSRTCEQEPHPFKEGWRIRCCYMSAAKHDECLVLVEERDPDGKVTVPSGMSFFHTAFELEGNRLEDVFAFADQAKKAGFARNYGPVRHNGEPPLGDGETGGNVACYFYDPDYQQRRILRRHGHDRELSRALRRNQGVSAGVTGKFLSKHVIGR